MSGRRFKIGDRVRIARGPHADRIGSEATVVGLRPMVGGIWWGDSVIGVEGCELDLPPHPACLALDYRAAKRYPIYPHWCLDPIYDGNQLASWSDCAWQPKCLIVETDTFVTPLSVPETP